jgi:hypothetical protein
MGSGNVYRSVATSPTRPSTAVHKFTTMYLKLALLQILTTPYRTHREDERERGK